MRNCAAHVLTEELDSCVLRVMHVSSESVTMYKNTSVRYLITVNSPCKSEIPSLEEQMAAPAGSLAVSDSTGAADCSS